MVDVDYYLGRKYDSLAQQSGAAATSAQAHLLSAQSGAGLDEHRGAALDAEAKVNPAHAALLQSQTRATDALSRFDYGGGAPAMPPGYDENGNPIPGYSTGVDSVPGPGDPRVDSVNANLAPQEAVLNAGAADMVGRGLIDVLNAMGALKMGMPAASPSPAMGLPAGKPGYARGTSNVAPKGGPTPAKGKGKADDNGAGASALMTFLRGMGGGGAPMGAPMGAPVAPPR